ncbi:FadR/GntR family transcriptional regulator [Georgenia halophila]|uniref:FadR/GntR family transcriptional regulator n=1 Tax=Georgenia halophila TaxID=620889 RepID=A0ABP8L2P4_9MICO
MKRGSLYRHAQDRLRAFIREGNLRPGDRLPPEATLATELGVSRMSLREATRSLQTLGVIEAQPGNGLFVAEFSFRPVIEQLPYGLADSGRALDEILTAREAMETGLMPALVRLGVQEDLTRCAELATEMSRLEAQGKSYAEVDRAFHLSLYQPLHNPLVDNLIELFWELYSRLGDAIPAPEHDRGEAHLTIVRALQDGDAAASVARMQEHFDDLRSRAARLQQATQEEARPS